MRKAVPERDSSDDGSSGMTYTLIVYPNSCGEEPTYLRKDWGVHYWRHPSKPIRTSLCLGGPLREGSNACRASRLGERAIVEGVRHGVRLVDQGQRRILSRDRTGSGTRWGPSCSRLYEGTEPGIGSRASLLPRMLCFVDDVGRGPTQQATHPARRLRTSRKARRLISPTLPVVPFREQEEAAAALFWLPACRQGLGEREVNCVTPTTRPRPCRGKGLWLVPSAR
jgi:hypothetical protein